MTDEERGTVNRQNAQHSTGPRTIEGKRASSRNALKHGLLATDVVMNSEDPKHYRTLMRELVDHFQPGNTMEAILVERLCSIVWRWRRLPWVEREILDADGETFAPDMLARIANLSKIESQYDRSFARSLNELKRLKAENGFVWAKRNSAENASGTGADSADARNTLI